jgi:N-acetylgalactosamine-6-phosphate deacetylase
VLITDVISTSGMPDGRYRLGAFEVEVNGDRCEYEGSWQEVFSPSTVQSANVMSFAAWSLQQAVRLATLNPAQVLGADHERWPPAASET